MLFLAGSKSSINVGGDDSEDNQERVMSPVYLNPSCRYLAVERHYFSVPSELGAATGTQLLTCK